MGEKEVVMLSDGPQGPSILYSDGTTEHFPVRDEEPPPLVADISFEETHRGFEVWFAARLAREHQDLVEEFARWLLGRPEVLGVVHDDDQVVQATGVLDDDLKHDVGAWWTGRVDSLRLGD